jgi:hypothetical protein
MKLISFSVEKYRSIQTTRKVPVQDYTLLVGPNNEGKSNILHALSLAMDALLEWQRPRLFRPPRANPTGKPSALPTASSTPPRRYFSRGYEWTRDYPIRLQKKQPNGLSNVTLEFELTPDEISEFREEIGSSLNGSLPIRLSFGDREAEVSIQKQGRGQATLNRKASRIARFVSQRIRFEYIPAIRTASSAERVIRRLVEKELSSLESHPAYHKALEQIEALQAPILDELGASIKETVRGFLPNVVDVTLQPKTGSRYEALRSNVEILVNDGVLTPLARKGDGVQSLVALALMRHASERSDSTGNSIVAIEEPESHLHPDAIHELRFVVNELSNNSQVVITSHSPLFVNREKVSCNVIVNKNTARPSKSLKELRETLGVRFSDNLQNASLVVLVEGYDDLVALESIVRQRSSVLSKAIAEGIVQFDELSGASGLSHKASMYINGACQVYAFMDNDAEAQAAFEKAESLNLLQMRDVTFASLGGSQELELEDLYDKKVYREAFLSEFGVDIALKAPGNKKKWSDRTGTIFRKHGKQWNGDIKQRAKDWLATFAADNPKSILHSEADNCIDAFISALENRLPQ